MKAVAGALRLTASRRGVIGGASSRLAWLLPAAAIVAVQLVVFPTPAGVWVQGLILGLLNALVTLGLALVYRSNRVVNFAQANLGALPAALGVGLIVISGVSYVAGLLLGTAAAVALGLAVEFLVIRRFASASRMTLTVVTIGLSQLLVAFTLLVPRLWGESILRGPNGSSYGVPWDVTVRVGGQVFGADDLVAAAVALICIAAVSFTLRSTSVGIGIRASADRTERAATLGVPTRRLQSVVWAVASLLSFLGLFLQGAIVGFPLSGTIGLAGMMSALAALALGGFVHVPSALAAAIAIGVLNKGVAWNNTTNPNTVYAVLAVVVMVGLLLRRPGTRRSQTDSTSSWRLPADIITSPVSRRGKLVLGAVTAAVVAAIAAVAVAVPLLLAPSQVYQAAVTVVLAIVGVSVVVLTGWAGQVTLGQMAFAAVGAAVGAVATVHWSLDLSVALLVAGAAGAVAAVVVGIPSLRFDGMFLAVTTLAFSLAASSYLLNPTEASWIPVGTVHRRPLFGQWDISGHAAMYVVCVVVLLLAIAALAGIRRSRSGRVLRSLRDNPRASESFGVSIVRAKLMSFAISGFLAGIAGCLLVYVHQGYDIAIFAPVESLNIFAATVVGGVASPVGAMLGSLLLNASIWLLPGALQLIPAAVAVLVVLYMLPGGLAQLASRARARIIARFDTVGGDAKPLVAPVAEAARTAAQQSTVTELVPADATLVVSDLRVAYDSVSVLFGVDFHARPGEIVALLGTNGAGKSTLLKAIVGIAPVIGGTVVLDGEDDITGQRPEAIAARSVIQMPGGQAVFPSLTVEENLRVATWLIRRDADLVRARLEQVYERFPVLESRRLEVVADMSGGQQQMLGLGMALLCNPRVLLIDELSLGLAPVVVGELLGVVEEIRAAGTTVVVVEQAVNVALSMADRAYFMEKGEMRFCGDAADLLERDDLLRAVYLHGAGAADGHSVTADTASRDRNALGAPRAANGERTAAKPVLKVSGLTVSFGGIHALTNVDLEVGGDEILAVIGPNGAGKTTLFDAVSGFVSPRSGQVVLGGVDVTNQSASRRARLGLGRSFQDSRLFPSMSVSEVVALALERWIPVRDPLSAAFRLPGSIDSEAAVDQRVEEVLDLLGLTRYRNSAVGELSTGVRGLVDLACVVAQRPDVVLLDEPSAGIAQREAEALAPLLVRVRRELGTALVIIEHDIGLLSSVADRMVALDMGSVVTAGTPEVVLSDSRVADAYLGIRPEVAVRSSPAGTPDLVLHHAHEEAL